MTPRSRSVAEALRWLATHCAKRLGAAAERRPTRARRPDQPPAQWRHGRLAGVLALVVAATACVAPDDIPVASSPITGPTGLRVTVDRVIDGDTIAITLGGTEHVVRLLGIDTPERPGGPRPAECFGAEASARMADLLDGQATIRLSRDRETRDQFGRLLAWVHREDGLFVNLSLIESGHAAPLFFPPNDARRPEFERAGNLARREHRGFWAACGAADVVVPAGDA